MGERLTAGEAIREFLTDWGPQTATALWENTQFRPSTVHHSLRQLRDAGTVEATGEYGYPLRYLIPGDTRRCN